MAPLFFIIVPPAFFLVIAPPALDVPLASDPPGALLSFALPLIVVPLLHTEV